MKKFIVFLLAAVLFVPFLSSAEESTSTNPYLRVEPLRIQPTTVQKNEGQKNEGQKFEKIISPDQIKNFTNIKKEGNALFGVKLQNLENKMQGLNDQIKNILANRPTSTLNSAATSTVSGKGLEKIAHPGELNLFEKIVKVGTALWGIRKANPEHLGVNQLSAETISCLKPVIDKKDAAVTTSLASSSQQLIDATNARNACQKTALDITTNSEVVKAFKVCKDNFNKAIKDTRISAKKYREEAWKAYQQEVKACYKSTNASTTATSSDSKAIEGGNVLMDDGGNNLDL